MIVNYGYEGDCVEFMWAYYHCFEYLHGREAGKEVSIDYRFIVCMVICFLYC